MPVKTFFPAAATADAPAPAMARQSEGGAAAAQDSTSPADLIEHLQRGIDHLEMGHRAEPGELIGSGCAAIDHLLPGGGYRPGGLVQWLTRGGWGADYLSLRTAVQACRSGGALVVVDPWRQFYPPTAAAIGVEMSSLIVLRPGGRETSVTNGPEDWRWAVEQALRCPAVAAVWGSLGPIDSRWFRRFQLAAESSGCLGLLVQSIDQMRQPTWADVQWVVGPCRRSESGTPSTGRQQVRLQLTRCRGARAGKAIPLAIDPISGAIELAARTSGREG